MAFHKELRLMNLVIALLNAERYVTAEKIRSTVAGYIDSPSPEAFSRMFERDKSELRELGIPLETGRVSNLDPTEGYRIRRGEYELPDIALSADETAAVAVAMQLWQSPELASATAAALFKLRAAGVDVDPAAEGTVAFATPGIGSHQALGALLAAVDSGHAVQFPHRPSAAVDYTTRTVEPWGVVTDHGRWYLVGRDRDRDAVRVFRLSRIGADVVTIGPPEAVAKPADADLRKIVADAVEEAPTGVVARIWVADGCAVALRRAGTAVERRSVGGRDGEVITIEVPATDRLAREIAGYGADALVLEPESLRCEVLERLRGQLAGAGL